MIRITKLPSIVENEDRWGIPTGTFYVSYVNGYVDEDLWSKIQEFEDYYFSEESKNPINFPELPHMSKIIGYAKTTIWQLNLCIDCSQENPTFIRSFALFGKKTFHIWTSEYDEKAKFLQKQVDQMNKKVQKEIK
jgi:hypothetical protein